MTFFYYSLALERLEREGIGHGLLTAARLAQLGERWSTGTER